ncbi:hypothetical protein K3728_07640 [Rhodobacteraceae bacterium M385]|nr:hypothetical protein K3728_07640 [Rhodobacteraceae bacterium M385]
MAERDDRNAWARIAQRVRDAGGRVENLRLGQGSRGRGLFVEDRAAPAAIALPAPLLIPVEAVELCDATLRIKADAEVTPEARALFDDYYASLGFSQPLSRDARRAISGLHQLPGPLQDMTLKGNRKGLERFPPFDDSALLAWFFDTRAIEIEGQRKLMPLVELTNHEASAAGFNTQNGGVEIAGRFRDEVLVRYHLSDPWGIYLRWGFVAPSDRLYSLGVEVREPGRWQIKVVPEMRQVTGSQDTQIRAEGRVLTIDRLLLKAPTGVEAARKLFRTQVAGYGVADPDELFSLIVKINKDWFNRILSLSKGGTGNAGLKTVRAAARGDADRTDLGRRVRTDA